jgi:hypothetical protein
LPALYGEDHLFSPESSVIEYSPPEVLALLCSGGEYSITDDGSVRPKHVLMEFRK